MIKKAYRFYKECLDDQIGTYAAQSAFFIILSAIPFLMVLLSLLKYTFLGKADLLNAMQTFCPDYLLPLLISIVDEVYEHSSGLLSVTAVVAVWSAAKGVQYITNGLNSVYDVDENRNWFVLRFWAIVYTLILVVVLLFLMGFMVFGKYIKNIIFKNFPQTGIWLFLGSWMKWLIGLVVLVGLFLIVFKALPNKKLRLRNQFVGACFTSIGWFVFSYGLSIYVNYFNGFSMYGSLTTLVLLMLWVYFCVYILLIGGEINAFLSERT